MSYLRTEYRDSSPTNRTALQYVPFTLAPALEPVAQPTPEPQSEQKQTRAPRKRSSTKLTDPAKAQPQDKAKGQRKSAKVKEGAK